MILWKAIGLFGTAYGNGSPGDGEMKSIQGYGRYFWIWVIALAVLGIVGWFIHPHWAPHVLQAAYEGRSFDFLNEFFEGRSHIPVEDYIRRTRYLVFGPLLSLIFYHILYRWVGALIRTPPRPIGPGETDHTSRRLGSMGQCLMAFILYGAVTACFFYPTLPTFSQALIGPPEDNMHHLWDIWWFRRTLSAGSLAGLTHSTYIGYPEGFSLLHHPMSFYNLILAYLLGPFLDPAPAYNLLVLHHFVLAGVGARKGPRR